MLSPDYAQFTLEDGILCPGPRMQKKLHAIPLPDLKGKTVLDVGCDFGQFSFYAATKGAKVTGLDRNREVREMGFVDLIEVNNNNARKYNIDAVFHKINLGKQWHEFGTFDHIFCWSVYHHIYQNSGDHKPVWLWLWRHCKESVIWEGPIDASDNVVQMNVSREYTLKDILEAAHIYFDSEYIGPALHEPNRHVYVFRPKKLQESYKIAPETGTGGATHAFQYGNERRMDEIEAIVGYRPFPGSLNCKTDKDFDYSSHYYAGEILDVKERGLGFDQEWIARETRFYPVSINGQKAHVFKMKGEKYEPDFIELIAPVRLRDGETTLCQL